MKNYLTLLLVTIMFLVACNAAPKAVVKNDTLTKLKQTDKALTLKSADIKVSQIQLGEKSKILAKFGKADSIVKVMSDFDNPDLRRYYIKGSYFEIDTDKTIYGFDIVSSLYLLDPFKIKIGESKKSISLKLRSYANVSAVKDSNQDLLKIKLDDSDDYLVFEFKKDTLTEYSTWSDN